MLLTSCRAPARARFAIATLVAAAVCFAGADTARADSASLTITSSSGPQDPGRGCGTRTSDQWQRSGSAQAVCEVPAGWRLRLRAVSG